MFTFHADAYVLFEYLRSATCSRNPGLSIRERGRFMFDNGWIFCLQCV